VLHAVWTYYADYPSFPEHTLSVIVSALCFMTLCDILMTSPVYHIEHFVHSL